MSPEAQRIAIAEACGWTQIHDIYAKGGPMIAKIGGFPPNPRNITKSEPLPDYLNDLNAMHEAEKRLNEDQWATYSTTLNHLVCACGNTATCGYTIAAIASQRAEAFLRTLNLWDDTK